MPVIRIAFFLPAFFILLFGCRTTKKSVSVSENKSLTDSSIIRERVSVDTFRVKKEAATLQISAKDIQNSLLREKSNGRAKVIVKVERDTLYVDAICDSLEHIILQRNKEVLLYRQLLNEKQSSSTIIKTRLPFVLWVLIILSTIGVLGIAAIYIYSRFKIF